MMMTTIDDDVAAAAAATTTTTTNDQEEEQQPPFRSSHFRLVEETVLAQEQQQPQVDDDDDDDDEKNGKDCNEEIINGISSQQLLHHHHHGDRRQEQDEDSRHRQRRRRFGSSAFTRLSLVSLYNRSEEGARLLSAFHRLVGEDEDEEQILMKKKAPPGLILITGTSGSGKTRLAKTLRDPVEKMGGYFLTAKFDQLQLQQQQQGPSSGQTTVLPTNCSSLISAFTEYATLLAEQRGTSTRMKARRAILECVGEDDVAILTKMIPALATILGKNGDNSTDEDDDIGQASSSSSPQSVPDRSVLPQAKGVVRAQRLGLVFRNFVVSACSLERPIVLLLDDLHWADQRTLDVVSSIVKEDGTEGLVVVATCADPIPNNSRLPATLQEIDGLKHNVASSASSSASSPCSSAVTKIKVSNLEVAAVRGLIADILEFDVVDIDRLAELATLQTGGNPSKIISFLRWLHQTDLLCLVDETWKWIADDVEMTINTREVDDYLVDALEQLQYPVKELLKVSACLGSVLDERLLKAALGDAYSPDALAEAACRGIISRDDPNCPFRFDHDYVQMAAYGLIPPDKRERFHLELGRRLWRRMDANEVGSAYLLTVVSQLSLGKRHIEKKEEQTAVAVLCFHAGTSAARSSDFRTALFYLEFGIDLVALNERCWRDSYDLCLSLYSAAAEMALCNADSEKMNTYIDAILRHARVYTDKIGAYCSRIYRWVGWTNETFTGP